ncbi:unnamed protein product [Timema podura]|uniref:UBX domain-containing protein 4 n=1 Tax=Timema podura TaxID=61482 RepID=A0ABN7P400_TIMPD|nr:unnamed protein product [Timema podura]
MKRDTCTIGDLTLVNKWSLSDRPEHDTLLAVCSMFHVRRRSDEASKDTATAINNLEVSAKLESDDFVAIKLDKSPAQSQSVLESKPSTSGSLHPSRTESSITSEANTLLSTTSPPETTPDVSVGSTLSASTSSAVKSEEPPTSIAKEVETAAGKEERIKRAQELLELKRLQKLKEEKEKERIKELERRQVGQEVQNMRRLQQDQELKQLKEERQREKAEDAAARGRILKQIEQDRAERAARFNSEKAAQQEELSKRQQEQLAEQARRLAEKQASSSSVAHIQFRIPNDSPHTHKFAATDTLADVYTYINSQLNLNFR